MKVLILSDKVEEAIYHERLRETFSDVELVLSCGDLPFYYLEYVVTCLNVPLYFVHGNHDPVREYASGGGSRTEPGGCQNLDGKVVMEKGLLLAGLEGSKRYKAGMYQYSEAEMAIKVLRIGLLLALQSWRYGRRLDILLTHAPPWGIHDAPDPCHQGFRSFRAFLDIFKPRYLLHGHSHTYHSPPAITPYRATLVVNTYGYRVMEI